MFLTYDILSKPLDEILEELKVHGDVLIEFKTLNWHFKYSAKLNGKEYMIETTGKNLLTIVLRCVKGINKFPIHK